MRGGNLTHDLIKSLSIKASCFFRSFFKILMLEVIPSIRGNSIVLIKTLLCIFLRKYFATNFTSNGSFEGNRSYKVQSGTSKPFADDDNNLPVGDFCLIFRCLIFTT